MGTLRQHIHEKFYHEGRLKNTVELSWKHDSKRRDEKNKILFKDAYLRVITSVSSALTDASPVKVKKLLQII